MSDFEKLKLSKMVANEMVLGIPYLSRLKGVKQAGISAYLNSTDPQYSRFEHIIDVVKYTIYFLDQTNFSDETKMLNIFTSAIHDIQHPAFSHVIENFLPNIQNTQRQIILNQLPMQTFIQLNNWTLDQFVSDGGNPNLNILKSSWPNINTDRLAYILADSFTPEIEINYILSNLAVDQATEIIYTHNIDTARILFEKSYNLAKKWKSPQNSGEYFVFGQIIKELIDLKLINQSSLYELSDTEIIGLIELMPEKSSIGQMWQNLRDHHYHFLKYDQSLILDSKSVEFTSSSHLRLLDPLVKIGSDYHRLSELDPSVARLITEAKLQYQQSLKFIAVLE